MKNSKKLFHTLNSRKPQGNMRRGMEKDE